MRINTIKFENLQKRTSNSRWGAGDPYRDRLLFSDAAFWYKVWDPRYIQALPVAIGSCFLQRSSTNNSLPGFDLEIFDDECASAFTDFIFDDNETLCGYITKKGQNPKVVDDNFVRRFAEKCIEVGWIYSDFCHNNLIDINGRTSLIDFDSHFTKLADFSVSFEKEKGCLRRHVHPVFREVIERQVSLLE